MPSNTSTNQAHLPIYTYHLVCMYDVLVFHSQVDMCILVMHFQILHYGNHYDYDYYYPISNFIYSIYTVNAVK